MVIDAIKNGIVIDHIKAGKSMEMYRILGLDKLQCSVAIIKNVSSAKMGKKDIIKIDETIDIDLDALGYVDPNITVNIIRDGVRVRKFSCLKRLPMSFGVPIRGVSLLPSRNWIMFLSW